ncbi:MAG: NAD(P)/FAD-dependent oxidoreductase [bacterium]
MKNRYDVVVIGGGPNGLGIACYLAKCGLSVCVCEDRMQVGGGAENTEPMPGFRIDPHATYFYGAAGPGVEQLELHRHGFRMVYYRGMMGGVTSDGKALVFGRYISDHGMKVLSRFSREDAQVWGIFDEAMQKHSVEILRSIYWTPPPPAGMTIDNSDLPWVKILKKAVPFFDESWCDMSTFDILEPLVRTEALKVMVGMAAWYNGPNPDWAGTGIFGLTCNLLAHYSSGSPVGGMHTLAHALLRCGLSHGVQFLTNSKVERIIVEDGEAKGVVLADDAPVKTKKILADRAVVSAVHVQDTFLKLIEPRDLELDFIEKVRNINLKGGSLFVLSLITTEFPRFKGDAEEVFSAGYPSCVFLPVDSRETVINQMRDVYSFNTHPTRMESIVVPFCNHDIYDPTRCPKGYHVFSPIYLQVPPPEYHVDGPLAVNAASGEITALILEAVRRVAPNLTEDKIAAKFVNTPYDSSVRNLGFIGGNWYGSREGEEEWYNLRPLPELSRYRTPVHKLYLCNHTSYPGGLCLLAVPYNLMHILIEDLGLEPGAWWYPSPYYIREGE